jgi:hypothetical protein
VAAKIPVSGEGDCGEHNKERKSMPVCGRCGRSEFITAIKKGIAVIQYDAECNDPENPQL